MVRDAHGISCGDLRQALSQSPCALPGNTLFSQFCPSGRIPLSEEVFVAIRHLKLVVPDVPPYDEPGSWYQSFVGSTW
jgi:hypothetical protein